MITTERGCLSVARFSYVFQLELRGPAWAVGSYSMSQSAGGTSQIMICKTYVQSGAAYFLRVPQAVGLNYSRHAAPANKGNFQKTMLQNPLLNLPPQTVRDFIVALAFRMLMHFREGYHM